MPSCVDSFPSSFAVLHQRIFPKQVAGPGPGRAGAAWGRRGGRRAAAALAALRPLLLQHCSVGLADHRLAEEVGELLQEVAEGGEGG